MAPAPTMISDPSVIDPRPRVSFDSPAADIGASVIAPEDGLACANPAVDVTTIDPSVIAPVDVLAFINLAVDVEVREARVTAPVDVAVREPEEDTPSGLSVTVP